MGVRWINYLRKDELEAKLVFLGLNYDGKAIELRKRLATRCHQATGEEREHFDKWEAEFLSGRELGAAGGEEDLGEIEENDIPQDLQITRIPSTASTITITATTTTSSFTLANTRSSLESRRGTTLQSNYEWPSESQ
ncbi:hypothetical protein ACFFRR_001082, partial [Megaselia abdita]